MNFSYRPNEKKFVIDINKNCLNQEFIDSDAEIRNTVFFRTIINLITLNIVDLFIPQNHNFNKIQAKAVCEIQIRCMKTSSLLDVIGIYDSVKEQIEIELTSFIE